MFIWLTKKEYSLLKDSAEKEMKRIWNNTRVCLMSCVKFIGFM